MVIKPRIRGFICTNAHPIGCIKNVQDQVAYVNERERIQGAHNALIVGCSTGYGLASRISIGFGCRANTIGVALEREPSEQRTGSAGWYNNMGYERECQKGGIHAETINGDAYSDEVKRQVIESIRERFEKIDLLVYSLASPVRVHPESGVQFRSSIKPIGSSLQSRTLRLDVLRGDCEVEDIELEPATSDEISSTVAVMGGEDWIRWIDALQQAEVLSSDFKTIAYTYQGNELTWPIYRGGTIGKAKEDLDFSCANINEKYAAEDIEALVAVLKAVVTQASTAIPVVPLYFSILFKAMKDVGTHEDCIAHIYRLFRTQVYEQQRRLDEAQRIRMDDFELEAETQSRVKQVWNQVNTGNVKDLADIEGFRSDFLRLYGFGRSDVDYDKEVDPLSPTL